MIRRSPKHVRRAVAAAAAVGAAMTVAAGPAAAVAGGTDVTSASEPYLASVRVGIPDTPGGRACSGALVAPQWVITAASCFGATAAGDFRIPAATPPAEVTVLGKFPVTGTRVVAPGGRDVALVKLAYKITTVQPVPLGETPPAAGAATVASGFGRTGDQWIPDLPHSAGFTVSGSAATTLALSGAGDTCKGDAGGPVLTAAHELTGVASASWQHGCFGETTTRQGSTATRTDDLAGWVRYQVDPFNSWYFLPGAGSVVTRAATTTARAAAVSGHSGSLTGKAASDLITRRSRDGVLFAYENRLNPTVDEQTYQPGTPIGTGWNIYNLLQQADLNGDGIADVLARDADGALWGYLGTGKIDGTTGTLKARVLIGERGWNAYRAIFAADTNGDRKAEVFGVAAGTDPAQLDLWGYPNNGFNGLSTLAARTKVATGEKEIVPSGFADFTGDGKADLFLVTDYASGSNDLGVLDQYANGTDADGTPRQPVTYQVGAGWTPAQRIALGDVNGDGHPDVIGTTAAGALNAYVHTGTFVRAPGQGAQTFSAPARIGTAAWDTMDVIT
jgi:hypothetical protein